jgi:uncharacterized protein YoxC
MTIVEGQVETLKKLKEALRTNSITRFNSVGEICSFLSDFETEKAQIPSHVERELETEIQDVRSTLESLQQAHGELSARVRNELEEQIRELNAGVARARAKSDSNFFYRIVGFFKISSLSRKASRLERNLEETVKSRTDAAGRTIARLEADLESLLKNRRTLASQRSEKRLQDLNHTKEVIDGLYTLVAGAIGESSVLNILRQLSDDHYLINDFSVKFDPPIYNKKEGDRIFSVQIDHLLISKSGIFLLETKNWSKASVQSLNLRSPVEQIRRTSFALFVMLNSDAASRDLRLAHHHWGAKKIPIRNLIVMIGEKPKEEFKYVKVLSLDELVGYIQYFDQTLNGDEVRSIFEYLKDKL